MDSILHKLLRILRDHVNQNNNKIIAKINISKLEQSLLLAQYSVGKQTFGNHYLLGKPPISFSKYKNNWLKKIGDYSGMFDCSKIGL